MKLLPRLQLAGRQDLVIAGILIAAVCMMVLPVPTEVVDMLIGCNLGISVLLLMVALYLRTPLDFASLPGVILISTVFRLSLAVTTTRLILVQGDAGEIILTFGEFVIAGNVVVGMVVFLIITIVQFVVVTKGAERVAEVGARFTLDAMPGKQMSIDADLRNGDIDQAEARRRRRVVEKESQLHGAMDGAMKFVKGDAIAGLIIIVINLVGGISIGAMQRHMPIGEAVQTYSLLTIGDALIGQIPALFMAITSAIIVTRVSDEHETNLGQDILRQITADKRALGLTAAVLTGMIFVPGFPKPVFVVLASGFIFASLSPASREVLRRRVGRQKPVAVALLAQPVAPLPVPAVMPTSPLLVRLGPKLFEAVGKVQLPQYVRLVRDQVGEELGILPPEVGVAPGVGLADTAYTLDLERVPVEHSELRLDLLLLRDDPVHADLLGLPIQAGAANGGAPTHWVDAAHAPALLRAGIGFNDPAQVLATRVREVLRRHAPGFVGIQETKALMAQMEREYADLVREVARLLPVQKIAELLRRLLEEGVSLRNMRLILEALAEWGERESRVLLLTEYVRTALSRQICNQYANEQKVLLAIVLEQDAEQAVRDALRETQVGVYLALDGETSDRLVSAVRQHLGAAPERSTPVLVASLDVRRYVRGLLVKNGIDIAVLSYQELSPDFPVQPIGSVGLAAGIETAASPQLEAA
jgi:type III secretion protein V